MLTRQSDRSGLVYYQSPRLKAIGVPHAFSTRIGGISVGGFASLNLGNPQGVEQQDSSDNIAENYRRLEGAIGCHNRRRCYVHQVHGAEIRIVGEEFSNGCSGDAIISTDPAKLLAIRTADCVPVLLASKDGSQVAAIHAGWRGIVAGIVLKTVKHFPRNTVPAIGPCIGFDAFEVGGEVLDEFARLFGTSAPIRRTASGKGHADLREAIRLQLLSAGIVEGDIDTTDRCTFRDADEFFSHRRERGVTGRMAALIGSIAPGDREVR